MRALRTARGLGRSAAACLLWSVAACGIATWPATIHEPGEPVPEDAGPRSFLKVHTHAGDLHVLSSWVVPGPTEDLTGYGSSYDADRDLLSQGRVAVPQNDIALLETNELEAVSEFAYTGMSVFTTTMGLTTALCLMDPKSCFGSCPTFYADTDADRPLAEGFSASFARVLEDDDLDALGLHAGPGPLSLVMRNEAQETHAVRRLELRAVEVEPGVAVVHTAEGDLWSVRRLREPRACDATGAPCRDLVSRRDDREYAPTTDPDDLGVREEVVLDFGPVSGEVGIVVSARHSFVTTYLFYQSLAYAGRSVGDLLAALERRDAGVRDRVLGLARELGPIEVLVADGHGPWRPIGSFGEAGPIAADRHLLPLGTVHARDLRVKLRMAKGGWRVDEVALGELAGRPLAISVEPDSVTPMGAGDPLAHERLVDPDAHLVTVSGDAYRIWFTLPPGGERQLFLESEGYYYEWVREGWLADENPVAATDIMLRPRRALQAMAPGFKRIEPDMERLFWSSRFRRSER